MLKKMMQDARNWEAIEEGLCEAIEEGLWEAIEERLKEQLNQPVQIVAVKKADEHLKGYIYDSLVFRYMKARDAEAELERLTQKVSYETSVTRANRDKMRFMEVLNEIMGTHD